MLDRAVGVRGPRRFRAGVGAASVPPASDNRRPWVSSRRRCISHGGRTVLAAARKLNEHQPLLWHTKERLGGAPKGYACYDTDQAWALTQKLDEAFSLFVNFFLPS